MQPAHHIVGLPDTGPGNPRGIDQRRCGDVTGLKGGGLHHGGGHGGNRPVVLRIGHLRFRGLEVDRRVAEGG